MPVYDILRKFVQVATLGILRKFQEVIILGSFLNYFRFLYCSAKYSCIVVVKPVFFFKIWALVCILVLVWQSILVLSWQSILVQSWQSSIVQSWWSILVLSWQSILV